MRAYSPKLFQLKRLVASFVHVAKKQRPHVAHDALFLGLIFSLLFHFAPLLEIFLLHGGANCLNRSIRARSCLIYSPAGSPVKTGLEGENLSLDGSLSDISGALI